ncbi:MAG: class I SAM-dependent methyltransferase [Betaproteobacteria bacterium]|nr:MAG: class I SAM-dependent methyltransferase [Betaproteobacteria bacterium]
MRTFIKQSVHKLGRMYLRRVLQSEAEAQEFDRHNERPAELSFVFRQVNRCAPRTILDVGSGTTALPALLGDCGIVVTAIDNIRDYWPSGMVNRHWHVIDDDISRTKLSGPFDMITCISVLEHIADHRAAFRNMAQLLKPGGHLVLAGPYTELEHIENSYKEPGADEASRNLPYICRSYSRTDLDDWLREGNCELIEAEYWRAWTGRHWALGQRIAPPQPSSREAAHNHACLLIRRRVQ